MRKNILSFLLAVSMFLSIFPWAAVLVSAATSGDYEYSVNADGTATITKYTGTETDLVIPSAIDGYKITSIGERAFANCTGLASVTIPEGVVFIGMSAFYECTSLTSVTILEGVKSIEWYAFSGCTSLTSVTIPASVTSIGVGAFKDCTSLASVTIPEGVTEIVQATFEGCTSLVSVTIPGSVKIIRDCAFSGCTSLASVTIPASVTSIFWYAFSGCSSLTDVYYSGSEEEWAAIYIDPYNEPLTGATIHYNSKGPVHSVSGSIAGFGDIGGDVTVELLSDGTAAYTATVENGVYSIPAAVPGTYTIRVSVDGRALYEDALTVGGAGAGAVEKEVRLYTVGDADMDIGVSMKDVLIVRKYLLGTVDESAVNYKAACVENGETLSMKDALSIRKYLVGLIDKFPVEG